MEFNHAEQNYRWHIKGINNLHFYQCFNEVRLTISPLPVYKAKQVISYGQLFCGKWTSLPHVASYRELRHSSGWGFFEMLKNHNSMNSLAVSVTCSTIYSETNSQFGQISKMKLFAIIASGLVSTNLLLN